MEKNPVEVRNEALKRRRQFINIFGGSPASAETKATIDAIVKDPHSAIEQLHQGKQITQRDAALLGQLADSDDPREKITIVRRVVREPVGHSSTIISMATLLAGDDEGDDGMVTALALDPLSVAVGFVAGFAVGVVLVMAVVVYTVVTSGTGSGSSGSGSDEDPEEDPGEGSEDDAGR